MTERHAVHIPPPDVGENMISNALKTDIEAWTARQEHNPVLRLAREGRLTHAMVTRYIANVTYMVGHTPRHLARARDRARELGDAPLERYFQHKLGEEIGHVAWGEADLASLAKTAA